MVDPQECITRQTSKAEPGTERNFRDIRRDRHKRDASTRHAQHITSISSKTAPKAREGVAALPYAEFVT